jgi:signal transduction histidine kinase
MLNLNLNLNALVKQCKTPCDLVHTHILATVQMTTYCQRLENAIVGERYTTKTLDFDPSAYAEHSRRLFALHAAVGILVCCGISLVDCYVAPRTEYQRNTTIAQLVAITVASLAVFVCLHRQSPLSSRLDELMISTATIGIVSHLLYNGTPTNAALFIPLVITRTAERFRSVVTLCTGASYIGVALFMYIRHQTVYPDQFEESSQLHAFVVHVVCAVVLACTVGATTQRRVNNAIVQAENFKELRLQSHRVMLHEIRTPMNVATVLASELFKGQRQHLRQRAEAMLDRGDRQRGDTPTGVLSDLMDCLLTVDEDVEGMQASLGQVSLVLTDLTDLLRVGEGKLALKSQPCSVLTVLHRARLQLLKTNNLMEVNIVDKTQSRVFFPPEAVMFGDPSRVLQVFQSILSHAEHSLEKLRIANQTVVQSSARLVATLSVEPVPTTTPKNSLATPFAQVVVEIAAYGFCFEEVNFGNPFGDLSLQRPREVSGKGSSVCSLSLSHHLARLMKGRLTFDRPQGLQKLADGSTNLGGRFTLKVQLPVVRNARTTAVTKCFPSDKQKMSQVTTNLGLATDLHDSTRRKRNLEIVIHQSAPEPPVLPMCVMKVKQASAPLREVPVPRGGGHERSTPDQRKRESAKRVLLVEDSATCAKVQTSMLYNMGVVVDVATNGLVATQMLLASITSKNSSFWSYGLVLMDVNMPVMDGIQVLSSLL